MRSRSFLSHRIAHQITAGVPMRIHEEFTGAPHPRIGEIIGSMSRRIPGGKKVCRCIPSSVCEGINMPMYRLYAHCVFCDEGHPFPFAVTLHINSGWKGSVADIYNGKQLPMDIENILNNTIQCTKSGNFFMQKNLSEVYLIPTTS